MRHEREWVGGIVDGGSFSDLSQHVEASLDEAPPLSLLALDPRPRSGWRDQIGHYLSLGLAGAVHLALLVLIMPTGTDALGEDGTALEAIAVAVVDVVPMPAVPAVAAPDAPPEEPVAEELPPPTPEVAEVEEPEPLKPPPKPEATVELQPASVPEPDVMVLPAAPPERKPEPPREEASPERERQPKPVEARATPQPQPPPLALPAQQAIAAAEASPGAVQAYGRQVAKFLASNPPRSRGLKGRVNIRFVIAVDGTPESATVLETSGKEQLDDIALSAVLRARFPRPPAEMTRQQLTFNVPYAFR